MPTRFRISSPLPNGSYLVLLMSFMETFVDIVDKILFTQDEVILFHFCPMARSMPAQNVRSFAYPAGRFLCLYIQIILTQTGLPAWSRINEGGKRLQGKSQWAGSLEFTLLMVSLLQGVLIGKNSKFKKTGLQVEDCACSALLVQLLRH